LKKEMYKHNNERDPNHGWELMDHNCCDAVRRSLRQCGCEVPANISAVNGGI